jgi:exodeoxyribonuclease VII small subunit
VANESAAPKAAQSYDQLVRDLEACVKDLEDGKLPLEQAIDRFKTGIELAKLAERRLQEAEGQVNLLLAAENGSAAEEPFQGTPEDAPRGPRVSTSLPAAPAPRSGKGGGRAGPAAGDDDIPF